MPPNHDAFWKGTQQIPELIALFLSHIDLVESILARSNHINRVVYADDEPQDHVHAEVWVRHRVNGAGYKVKYARGQAQK